MKPASRLKLAEISDDEPSRSDIAMAEIEQEHSDSKWTPFSETIKHPILRPDDVHTEADLMLQSMVGKQ